MIEFLQSTHFRFCQKSRLSGRQVAENGGRHPKTGREKLREILMSGGDPMVLSNRNIAQWLSALAENGIEECRT